MNRYLGDWMENEHIIPTNEEVGDLYLAVEESPDEFDYTCEDVLEKAGIRGLSRMYLPLAVEVERAKRKESTE